MASNGILDIVYSKYHQLVHLDDGSYLMHTLYTENLDNMLWPTNTYNDDTLDIEALNLAVDNAWHTNNNNEVVRRFTDSTGQAFTMEPGDESYIIIRRADSSTAMFDMDKAGQAFNYSSTGSSGGDGFHIDINSFFLYPNYFKGVYVFNDSSNQGFEITQASTDYFTVERGNGETYFFKDPYVYANLDARAADGTLGAYNGTIDIAAMQPNIDSVIKMIDSSGAGFEVTTGSVNTTVITRDNGDQYMIDSANLILYSDPTVAGTGVPGEIDLDKLISTQLGVPGRFVYKFEDSSGQDFKLSYGSWTEMIATRADGTVIIFEPKYSIDYSATFDTYSTTGPSGGVSDGVIDIAALYNNTNLNVGSQTNIMSLYDSTGMGFKVTSAYDYLIITRDDGEVYMMRSSSAFRDQFDEWSVDGGFTGGDNDGRIDIAAIAKWQTTGNDNTWQYNGGASPCFVNGTRIETPKGMVAVEELKVGDKVRTKGNGMQNIQWIGSKKLSAFDLQCNEKLSPVRITAGALGNGLPRTDLLVSRQHRMYVRSDIAKRMFGETEVLVAAIALTKLPGIYVDFSVSNVEYFHIAFNNHEVIFAEGAPAESLYFGPDALQTLSKDAVEEIYTLFPHIKESILPLDSARFIPNLKQQNKLIERLSKNGKHAIC